MASPQESQQHLTLQLPPGLLGADIQKSTADGTCVVTSETNEASPLLHVGDVIESFNGMALVDVEGGVSAWVTLMEALDNDTRTVVVRRRWAGDGIPPAADVANDQISNANTEAAAATLAAAASPSNPKQTNALSPSARYNKSNTIWGNTPAVIADGTAAAAATSPPALSSSNPTTKVDEMTSQTPAISEEQRSNDKGDKRNQGSGDENPTPQQQSETSTGSTMSSYRSGWTRPPTIHKSAQTFVPSMGNLGETAAQKRLKESKAALQQEKEEETRKLQEMRDEADRLEEERLDLEILEKRMAVEKLEQEQQIQQEGELNEQRMIAAASLVPLVAAPTIISDESWGKAEEGTVAPAASTEENLDQTTEIQVDEEQQQQPAALEQDKEVAEETVVSSPNPIGRRQRRERTFKFLLLLLLLLTAVAITLGVLFGSRTPEDSASSATVAIAGVGVGGGGNETDFPSIPPSSMNPSNVPSESPSATLSFVDTTKQYITDPSTVKPSDSLNPTTLPTSDSTPQPSCTNTPGYSDLIGNSCEYYENSLLNLACLVFGDVENEDGMTPNTNCCVCEGVVSSFDLSLIPFSNWPTSSPSELASPSDRPTAKLFTGSPMTLAIGSQPPTTLDIEAIDTSIINSGGAPNTRYPFILKAETIPDGIGEVRFEWTPGLGAGGSANAMVVGGKATTTVELSYPTPGLYDITASVYDGQKQLAIDSLQVQIAGTILSINPPGLTDAQSLVPYTFNFIADGIPSSMSNVKFTWSFGVGQSGAGNSDDIPVSDVRASSSASQIYTANGAYGLVVDVRDSSTNTTLAQSLVTVFVGLTKERDNTLGSCNDWSASQAGGEGVTIDNWDISAIPEGTVFDVRYEAHNAPDKFIVDYPVGNRVLDSGWRGSSSNDGSQLYPGGISGDGTGEVYNIFPRLTQYTFRVTVIGPDPGTAWEYDVRCRTPKLADNDVCTVGDECPSAACGYESFSTTSSTTVCCSSAATTTDSWPSSDIRRSYVGI